MARPLAGQGDPGMNVADFTVFCRKETAEEIVLDRRLVRSEESPNGPQALSTRDFHQMPPAR